MINTTIPLKTIGKIQITEPVSDIAEIRLRSGRCAVVTDIRGNIRVCSSPFSDQEIARVFEEICEYSVYSHQSEIAEGYITLAGGHRVGICGSAVYREGRIDFIKDVSGLNIRIAHQVKGCADLLYKQLFGKGLCSALLIGKPLSGKTTLLRDLARLLGEKYPVCIIDSRNEISASYHGTPSFDIGLNTDALCGFSKSEGIMTALRTLSPRVIICDEISGDERAIEQCAYCGVKLIASAHGGSFAEINNRFSDNLLACFEKKALIGKNFFTEAVS